MQEEFGRALFRAFSRPEGYEPLGIERDLFEIRARGSRVADEVRSHGRRGAERKVSRGSSDGEGGNCWLDSCLQEQGRKT